MGEGANGFGNGEIVMGMMLMKSGRMVYTGSMLKKVPCFACLLLFFVYFRSS